MIPTLIPDLIAQRAEDDSTRLALVDRSTRLTYGDLWSQVRGVATHLRRLGLRADDRVAIYLDKRTEAVVASFASALAGGVFVPLNPLLRDAQVGHVLNDCRAAFLVTSGPRLHALEATLEPGSPIAERCKVLVVDADPDFDSRHLQLHAWTAELDPDPAELLPRRIDTDMAAILYTSGSTGAPKGVVLSHRNMVSGALSVNQYLENGPSDRILAALPLSFDAGLSQLTTGFAAGARVILLNFLTGRDLVKACGSEGVTGLTGVPPLWNQLVHLDWPSETRRNLRYFANTGGHLSGPTLSRLRQLFPGAKPFLMYGLTEAFRSTYLDPAEVDRRPGSIGKAIPNAEILVVSESGELCEPGQEGELVHRGALVSLGYWNDPVRTAERFRPAPGRAKEIMIDEPAVWSGDTVRLDEEGFLYFVGRKDGMIKASGYRVSATEIEELALAVDGVADAAAIGVPHPTQGQAIVLVVCPSDHATAFDTAAVSVRCREALPLYMVPSRVVVRSTMPLTSSGKIDRLQLTAEFRPREDETPADKSSISP
jgi:acyl-CoA ligase (AMP-forming) (exosortase A-associated)